MPLHSYFMLCSASLPPWCLGNPSLHPALHLYAFYENTAPLAMIMQASPDLRWVQTRTAIFFFLYRNSDIFVSEIFVFQFFRSELMNVFYENTAPLAMIMQASPDLRWVSLIIICLGIYLRILGVEFLLPIFEDKLFWCCKTNINQTYRAIVGQPRPPVGVNSDCENNIFECR